VEGIGPGSDGLSFEGFQGPEGRHLSRDDAAQVLLEVQFTDDSAIEDAYGISYG
jgi:hypothetical protein